MMDLHLLSVILMCVAPFLIVLAWSNRGALRGGSREMGREKQANEIHAKERHSDEQIKTDNPYLQRYYRALDKGDMEEMQNALIECKNHCSGANSWCLTEMFCPDCPMGGLPVMSGRGQYGD